MDQQHVDIVFCIPGERFSSNFLTSWTKTITYLSNNKITWIYINRYTPIVSLTRNSMIRLIPGEYTGNPANIIPFENKVVPKKIIFIDHDMVWDPSDIEKLILSDKDIVGGFYKMQQYNEHGINCLAATKNNKLLTEEDIKNKTELIELDGVGFGIIAINFNLFNEISYPWFETFEFFNEKENSVFVGGEDFNFCIKAKQLGYKIYGDPTIKVGHEKLVSLDFKK